MRLTLDDYWRNIDTFYITEMIAKMEAVHDAQVVARNDRIERTLRRLYALYAHSVVRQLAGDRGDGDGRHDPASW